MRKVVVVLVAIAILSLAMYGIALASDPYGPVSSFKLHVSSNRVFPGQTITCSGTGFSPNSKCSILWDGVVVADTFADANGNVTFSFTIPSNARTGLHTLMVMGPGQEGGTHVALALIRVLRVHTRVIPTRTGVFPLTGGLPIWILLIAGLVLVVGGFGLKIKARS